MESVLTTNNYKSCHITMSMIIGAIMALCISCSQPITHIEPPIVPVDTNIIPIDTPVVHIDTPAVPIEPSKQIVVATMGASLMYPGNGWVEIACSQLKITCLNKAASSKMPWHFAQQLWLNEYATEEELESIDILLIQFAQCKNVYGDSTTFFTTADEYTRNYTESSTDLFKEYTYAQQIDYILKKWQDLCARQNKPMHVIFVTHWHDGRVVYNESVRKLAARWNADVCELDKNIGFTKDKPLSDGTQPSIQFAQDTEDINGVTFGWHPLRGTEGEYIQHKMASILLDKLNYYIKTQHIN